MVMVVGQGSTVEGRTIQTGQNIGDRILVSDGVQPGEQVIVSGLQKIRAGVAVKPVERQAKPAVGQTASPKSAAKTE
jgi:membrane fusion protein (multidrug efflux system)